MSEPGSERSEDWNVVYRDDYLLVTEHDDERVAVWTGNPPEDSRPTVVDARDLVEALLEYLTTDSAPDGYGGFVTEFEALDGDLDDE